MSQTQKYTVIFSGKVTAESPVCTNPPSSGESVGAKAEGSSKAARQPRMTVFYGTHAANVPYFPAAGFRGKLRRKGLDVARRFNDTSLSLDDYYYNAIGGVKDVGAEDANLLTEATLRREVNPIVGLYGAGAPWIKGCASIGHMIPVEPIQPIVVTGTRNDDFRRGENALQLLSSEEQENWLAVSRNNSLRSRKEREKETLTRQLRTAGAEDAPAIKARIEKLDAEIKEHSAISGSVSVNLPLAGYEAIPQGTVMNHKIVLTEATFDEIGMFLAQLQEFSFDPHIGSRFNQGNGLISAEYEVRVRKSGDLTTSAHGDVRIVPYEGLAIKDAFMQDALDSFTTRLQNGDFDFSSVDRVA